MSEIGGLGFVLQDSEQVMKQPLPVPVHQGIERRLLTFTKALHISAVLLLLVVAGWSHCLVLIEVLTPSSTVTSLN